MIAIAEAGARFISRGDDSGTHAKEKLLWTAAGLDVPSGADWYVETGQGMGATLTVAAATSGYVLTDRATYLVVADGSALPLLISGDPQLRNIYDVIVVLGYNDDPVVPGCGSTIFLHRARPDFAPTEGCIAVALEDLLAVLEGCEAEARLCVVD